MKLEPGEFKVITSLPIKPRHCCRLSLGGQLISWANSAAHQKHKLENLHGVIDMDMMTGCSDLCPLCGGGTHAEKWGPPESSPLLYSHPSSLFFTAPGAAYPRWDSNAGGSYNSPTAAVSGLSERVPTSSWMPPGMNEQKLVSHFNTFLYFCFGPQSKIIQKDLLSWGN